MGMRHGARAWGMGRGAWVTTLLFPRQCMRHSNAELAHTLRRDATTKTKAAPLEKKRVGLDGNGISGNGAQLHSVAFLLCSSYPPCPRHARFKKSFVCEVGLSDNSCKCVEIFFFCSGNIKICVFRHGLRCLRWKEGLAIRLSLLQHTRMFSSAYRFRFIFSP